MICSTLSGQMAIKHPKLGILVREDGCVLSRIGKSLNKARWIRGCLYRDGYRVIGWHRKYYRVHRLVAECFIPNPDNKPTVDHIDRNRQNNAVSNLRWATYKEQVENSSGVLNRKDYGVRYCQDIKAYTRAHNKDYRSRNRTALIKRSADYYKAHCEERKEHQREYHQMHRDEHNAKMREYHRKHREQNAARCRKYREEHQEEFKAKQREYYQKHREEILAKKRLAYKYTDSISDGKARCR